MAARFLAARSGSFQRAARIVQPHVAAGHHLTRHMDVVILNKHEAALELCVFAQMDDVLDEAFPFVIPWMRFPREHELHRSLLVADEFYDVFELLEDQRRALVSSK